MSDKSKDSVVACGKIEGAYRAYKQFQIPLAARDGLALCAIPACASESPVACEKLKAAVSADKEAGRSYHR